MHGGICMPSLPLLLSTIHLRCGELQSLMLHRKGCCVAALVTGDDASGDMKSAVVVVSEDRSVVQPLQRVKLRCCVWLKVSRGVCIRAGCK